MDDMKVFYFELSSLTIRLNKEVVLLEALESRPYTVDHGHQLILNC